VFHFPHQFFLKHFFYCYKHFVSYTWNVCRKSHRLSCQTSVTFVRFKPKLDVLTNFFSDLCYKISWKSLGVLMKVIVAILQVLFIMSQKVNILKFHPKEWTKTHTHYHFVQISVIKWNRNSDIVTVIPLEIEVHNMYSTLETLNWIEQNQNEKGTDKL